MAFDNKLISLEMACKALRQQDISLLAELAKSLSSVLLPDAEFNPETVRYLDDDPINPQGWITYGELASYFQAATGKWAPVLFETPRRTIESHRVLINSEWLNRRVTEARESLGLISTIRSASANQVRSIAKRANSPVEFVDQPLPMSREGLKDLHRMLAHQNDQRKAQQAASKESLARREAENRAIRAEMVLQARESELREAREQLAFRERELSDEHRAKVRIEAELITLEEQLEKVFGLAEFLNVENPLSPPEGRQLFECWSQLTQNGCYDIVAVGRIGMKELARKWLRNIEGKEPREAKLKAYSLLLTSSTRKSGGVLPSREDKKR